MALEFTGKHVTNENSELTLEAYDGDKRVVVITSAEAIRDNGLPAVQTKAAEKYDMGLVDEVGRPRVFTVDFRNDRSRAWPPLPAADGTITPTAG